MRLHEKAFSDLAPAELHAILALRQRVFVVEQNCAYLDADDYDLVARHLWLTGDDGVMVAYARVFAPGTKFEEASLGRVVSAPEARRTGAGREIVRAAIAALERLHGRIAIRISAQSYLETFYRGFGFERASGEYLEDGIPHVDMRRPAR